MAYNISRVMSWFEYPPEVTTKEWLGRDYSYHVLIKNENEAERFNYHGDYWGSAEEYQEENVMLMAELEPYIGERCYVEDGADYIEGTLEGILIDRQYNSISHTCILFSDVADKKTAYKRVMRKRAYDEEDEDVQFLYDLAMTLSRAGYDVETFEDAGLLTSNLGLVINGNQFSWLGSYAGW